MTFDEYQKKAITTDSFAGENRDITSIAFMSKVLGLVGEAGEVAEKFKKIYRNKRGEFNDQDRQEIAKELGDTLWYLCVVGDYIGLSFEDVAKGNLQKLQDRKKRDVITSKGDNR